MYERKKRIFEAKKTRWKIGLHHQTSILSWSWSCEYIKQNTNRIERNDVRLDPFQRFIEYNTIESARIPIEHILYFFYHFIALFIQMTSCSHLFFFFWFDRWMLNLCFDWFYSEIFSRFFEFVCRQNMFIKLKWAWHSCLTFI